LLKYYGDIPADKPARVGMKSLFLPEDDMLKNQNTDYSGNKTVGDNRAYK
jgi:hypothetical protein